MPVLSIGFAGLGVMGASMAGHLVRAKHDVIVWNRTPSKCEPLAELGADVADSLDSLAQSSDLIFLCLRGSEDVAEVCAALGRDMSPQAMIVDHSTIDPEAARQISDELAQKKIRFVDAPITGGSMGAKNGTLTIFCGGSESDVTEILPYVAAYSSKAERVGPIGAGQTMKLANQIAVGGALLALCESLSFAHKAGLSIEQARDLIGGGAAGSWAFDYYGPKILAKDWTPGFSIDNQQKDFGYCRATAKEIGAAIPTTLLAEALLASMQAEGKGDLTTAALYERMLELGFEA